MKAVNVSALIVLALVLAVALPVAKAGAPITAVHANLLGGLKKPLITVPNRKLQDDEELSESEKCIDDLTEEETEKLTNCVNAAGDLDTSTKCDELAPFFKEAASCHEPTKCYFGKVRDEYEEFCIGTATELECDVESVDCKSITAGSSSDAAFTAGPQKMIALGVVGIAATMLLFIS